MLTDSEILLLWNSSSRAFRGTSLDTSGTPNVRVTERYYAAWTDSRQRQVEADLKRAWEHDPIVLLQAKATNELRGKNEAVN
jgi:hypothetical protein